jgi:hypothetical protein
MTESNRCMICYELHDICHELRCGDILWGIIYCLPCLESGKVRDKIMNQMTDGKFVPCISFINTELKFYRKTQNAVVDAKVMGSSRAPTAFIGDQLLLLLSYEEDFGVSRHVPLANILKHSPEFYDQIVACENLLKGESIVNPGNGYTYIEDSYKCQFKHELVKNEIVISYQNTPDWFKLAVENARLLAEITASCDFEK